MGYMGSRTRRRWAFFIALATPVCAAAFVFGTYAPANPPPFGVLACTVLALFVSGANCALALREAAQWREAAEEAERLLRESSALNECLLTALWQARDDRNQALRGAGHWTQPHRRDQS
jgi:hypothetical protein